MALFAVAEPERESETTSTFADTLSLPIHRWFRYAAGFSAVWVSDLMERERANGRRTALDPFVGSGTALLEAERSDLESIGVEAHPFIVRVARSKLHWREDPVAFREFARAVLEGARKQGGSAEGHPSLMKRCFPAEVLARLDSLRRAWAAVADGSPLSELSWLALASIIRECSPVGTAQWQYVLPRKTKASARDPYAAFSAKLELMCRDITHRQRRPRGPRPHLLWGDARACADVPDGWADLVVTSPPYANNYDYADATRLEMTFFGEIRGWGDLQDAVRRYLIRSCTQHVAGDASRTATLLGDPLLEPIGAEINAVCGELERERAKHGGKKPYHAMIAAYFSDMAHALAELRRATAPGALGCLVIGDSAPYGVYVPVDRWLGELAVAAGFAGYRFEKTRDRNVKWKNRKHRVPLHEGRLWIAG
jgi:hypothetical protein